MFDKNWFAFHQQRLLWLANTSFGKNILSINGTRSSFSKEKIVGILPNAIFVRASEKQYAVEIRTHNKFSKRIYYAGLPLWKAFHWFDMQFANRFAPRLNLGFDTTGDLFPAAGTNEPVDGMIRRSGVDQTWAAIIAGAGTSNFPSLTGDAAMLIDASGTSNQWAEIRRGIFLWDTSVIGAGATVDSGTMSHASADVGGTKADALSQTPNIAIVASTPGSTSNLANTDYGQLGSTEFITRYTYANWSGTDNVYNDMSLNASGLSHITVDGLSKFGLLNGQYDLDASAPSWSSGAASLVRQRFADDAGTSSDPKLNITFTPVVSSNFLAIL